MRVDLHCPSCVPAKGLFTLDLLPKNDCVYEITCPTGHQFVANILYHEFQKLFEVAVSALADDYYREAVGSFAASHERFMELFIRTVMKTRGVNDGELVEGWKKISRQSERQMGAFIVLFVQEFGTQPPLLPNTQIEMRNRVVHQGYFPTKDQCIKYGNAVLDAIRQTIVFLYNSEPHNRELISSINSQGDFSSTGPKYHYYAYALIGTNRSPDLDKRTLSEMLEHVVGLRRN